MAQDPQILLPRVNASLDHCSEPLLQRWALAWWSRWNHFWTHHCRDLWSSRPPRSRWCWWSVPPSQRRSLHKPAIWKMEWCQLLQVNTWTCTQCEIIEHDLVCKSFYTYFINKVSQYDSTRVHACVCVCVYLWVSMCVCACTCAKCTGTHVYARSVFVCPYACIYSHSCMHVCKSTACLRLFLLKWKWCKHPSLWITDWDGKPIPLKINQSNQIKSNQQNLTSGEKGS